MGGFLQALLSGYGGIRLRVNELTIQMQLPPNTTTYTITGIDYRHAAFTIRYDGSLLAVTMTEQHSITPHLGLFVYSDKKLLPFTLNQPIKMTNQKVAIRTMTTSSASVSSSDLTQKITVIMFLYLATAYFV